MALSANLVWRIRPSGLETNGGGYDATVSGAGTDYSDQDSPQLSITDLTSTASTTVTSVLSTFTSAMVGNVLRIASGTGATTGYYMITTYVSASQITLDRVSGTYTAGVAKVGGAWNDLRNASNGGNLTAPVLTTPVAAGHKVYMRGAGSDDPSSADYTMNGYYTTIGGNNTSGYVLYQGYNGRPRIDGDALNIYNVTNQKWKNFKFVSTNANNNSLGKIMGTSSFEVSNIYIDQAGNDHVGVSSTSVFNCWFKNSGSTSAGQYAAIQGLGFAGVVEGNYIDGWRGSGISPVGAMGDTENNVIVNCKLYGISLTGTQAAYTYKIKGNTIYGNTSDGIRCATAPEMVAIFDNIITNNGGYGVNFSTTATTLNDKMIVIFDYNNYGTGGTANTSGAVNNATLGSHDVALDPQFTNAGAGDFSVGTNMKAIGFPALFPAGTTTSYVDLGAAQRIEGSSGSSTNSTFAY